MRVEALQPRNIWVWGSTSEFSGVKEQPRIRTFACLQLIELTQLPRTRVFATLELLGFVKFALKLVLLVISRLRAASIFLITDAPNSKKHIHRCNRRKKKLLGFKASVKIGPSTPLREGFID